MQQLSAPQLMALKQELYTQNQQHRFIIIHLQDQQQGSFYLITDHQRLTVLREKHPHVQISAVQDIIPITDRLAYWALAQQEFTAKPWDLVLQQQLLQSTNAVLKENHHPTNLDFPWNTTNTFDHPAEQ
ncbi:MAG TPA: hypothetical protein DCW31_01350 [Lactobacillus sp.]|nr:hypothetical protein [Lactobacillus sp.]